MNPSQQVSSKTKERVWWDEVDVTRKRLREEKLQGTEEGATKQNDSAAAPSDQGCPPSFNIKSSRTKHSPVVCPRHGIAGGYLENCICISRTTSCICITSSMDPSYISSRDWALYHLPASKIPFAGREKSAANLVLLWILVRCRNSSQVSFKVRCAGPLPLLLDEVDFVNVRLDSRNLDCQPLNPWTSMAAGNALGPAFYRRSRLADLLNHPQEFLAEIEQYSLTRSFAWFPTKDAHAAA